MSSAVHVTEAVDALVGLPTATAADVKRLGWRKIMDTAQSQGAVVVTHHGVPEGVVVSAAEFERMQAAGRAAQATQEQLSSQAPVILHSVWSLAMALRRVSSTRMQAV
ncbi:type II toxin-antitoxin system prevent-host-death family antitoxin, partial [Pseudoxanthomonas spadix]